MNNNHEVIINKSRQIGISYIIALKALMRAVGHKKNELIISPSQRQSKHVMDYINQFYKQLSNHVDMNILEETKTSLIFNDGGEIYSLPNSANTIRGYRADDIYIDEFAHFTNNTDVEIINAITPSITRGDSIWYISTPFGDQNLFYDFWHHSKMVKISYNWRECPDFTHEKMDNIRSTIGEDAFMQEFENQFLSDNEDQEFPTVLIKSCINPELIYKELDKNRVYLAGADIGRKQDQTAFSMFEKNKDNQYIMVYHHVMRNTPYNEQKNFFQHMLNNYRFNSFYIDETGIGNMFAEELHRIYGHITPITFNNENKQSMVANLKRLMQEKKLQIPDDPLIIDNLRSIKRIYTSSNYLRYDSVHDNDIGHADLFWSIALALYDESKNKQFVMPCCFDFGQKKQGLPAL